MQLQNFQHTSDQQLLTDVKTFIAKERQLTAVIVEHLFEIERRKLYCDLKYKSLFDYCTRELGYSEDQACRRINAMRVRRELPAVKEKLGRGALTLTSLNLFSAAKNELELNTQEQSDLLARFEKKSKRACLAEVDKLRSEKGRAKGSKRAIIRAEGGTNSRLSLSLNNETLDKLRSLAAEKRMDLSEFVTYLVEKENAPAVSRVVSTPAVGKGRYISKKAREIIRARESDKCENCGSRHRLQIDHRHPFALGGKSELENLRPLCSNCNIREGVKVFGVKKMRR